MGIGKYFKTAFMNRWNLLLVGGAAAFALLTPIPDVVLAIVAAAELTYLGLLGTHWLMHVGQFVPIRRKLGKSPLF